MKDLAGKHIVLGLTGGIACFKAAELCRSLVKEGATVQVVMTEAAEHFITPVTMQALSNRPVYGSQWDPREPNNMPHINLSREADAILIAPASADFMAKLLHGRADDLLSLMCLARPAASVPLIVAPAMNREMWAHPATQRNVAQLKADGVEVLDVGQGEQACGETGDGRMLEADEILADLIAFFTPKVLAGQHVLVTAGPTYEAIDPVRGITNLSSGKMGFAIARAAREAGADVTLVAGPVSLPTPRAVGRVNVKSARDMLTAVQAHIEAGDGFCCHCRRRRLATRDCRRPENQEGRLRRHPGTALHREPGHPGHGGAVAARPAWTPGRAERPVLRRFCRRKPRPAGPRHRQAQAQGRAAAGGQHRPGHFRAGRQRAAAGGRAGRDRSAARFQARACSQIDS